MKLKLAVLTVASTVFATLGLAAAAQAAVIQPGIGAVTVQHGVNLVGTVTVCSTEPVRVTASVTDATEFKVYDNTTNKMVAKTTNSMGDWTGTATFTYPTGTTSYTVTAVNRYGGSTSTQVNVQPSSAYALASQFHITNGSAEEIYVFRRDPFTSQLTYRGTVPAGGALTVKLGGECSLGMIHIIDQDGAVTTNDTIWQTHASGPLQAFGV